MNNLSANDPHISTLEQVSPQVYIRFILCFGLPSDCLYDDTIKILHQSLDATAVTIPVLNSLVVSIIDSNGRETKDLRRKDIAMFTVKDLTSKLNFDDIKSQGFPAVVFDGDLLCPTGVLAIPGSPIPVFLAQANFISGGLLLALSVWHGVFDGMAITAILQLWAQNCRNIQDPGNKGAFTLSNDALDKSRLSKIYDTQRVSIDDHPEFLLLPETAIAPPSASTPALKTEIFYFSPASISALKNLTSPKKASSHTEYSWVSTSTAISALTWRSVMAARYHKHPIPDSLSVFCTPFNARVRMNPPLTPDLLANAISYHDSRLSITSLLEANLADIALIIRSSTEKDANHIDSLINMIDGVSNPSLLIPFAFKDILKTGMMLTNWAGFPMYEFDWGSALGGKCERMRLMSSGMFNGLQLLLPELTKEMGKGLEIVVGLEDDDAMERLKGDEVWRKFAQWGSRTQTYRSYRLPSKI